MTPHVNIVTLRKEMSVDEIRGFFLGYAFHELDEDFFYKHYAKNEKKGLWIFNIDYDMPDEKYKKYVDLAFTEAKIFLEDFYSGEKKLHNYDE